MGNTFKIFKVGDSVYLVAPLSNKGFEIAKSFLCEVQTDIENTMVLQSKILKYIQDGRHDDSLHISYPTPSALVSILAAAIPISSSS